MNICTLPTEARHVHPSDVKSYKYGTQASTYHLSKTITVLSEWMEEIVSQVNLSTTANKLSLGYNDRTTVCTIAKWTESINKKHISPLGEALLALRKEIINSGEELLSWDEIYSAVSSNRGEESHSV